MRTDQIVSKLFAMVEKECRNLDFQSRLDTYGSLVDKLEEGIALIQDEMDKEYEDTDENDVPTRFINEDEDEA